MLFGGELEPRQISKVKTHKKGCGITRIGNIPEEDIDGNRLPLFMRPSCNDIVIYDGESQESKVLICFDYGTKYAYDYKHKICIRFIFVNILNIREKLTQSIFWAAASG